MLWAIVWPDGRVMRSAGQAWSPLSPEDGWSTSRAECVAADPRGGVWIGTNDAGIKHWQNGAVTETLDQSNGLASNDIGSLLATASGELWIGPRGAEVVQCRKDGQLRTFQLPSGGGSVIALAMDSAGDCWVATYGRRLLRVRGEVLTRRNHGHPGGAVRNPGSVRHAGRQPVDRLRRPGAGAAQGRPLQPVADRPRAARRLHLQHSARRPRPLVVRGQPGHLQRARKGF